MVAYQCHGSNVGKMGTLRSGNQGGTVVADIADTLCNNGKAAGSATQQDAETGMLVATVRGEGSSDRSLTAHPTRMDLDTETFVAHTLRGDGHDVSEDGTGRGVPCHPLAAQAHAPSIAGQFGVRRLTPTEMERLQGFPDGWTLVPYRNGMAADGPRAKALGNSMAVPVLRWLGERILRVESARER